METISHYRLSWGIMLIIMEVFLVLHWIQALIHPKKNVSSLVTNWILFVKPIFVSSVCQFGNKVAVGAEDLNDYPQLTETVEILSTDESMAHINIHYFPFSFHFVAWVRSNTNNSLQGVLEAFHLPQLQSHFKCLLTRRAVCTLNGRFINCLKRYVLQERTSTAHWMQ